MTTFGEKLGGEFLPHWCWNGLKNAKKQSFEFTFFEHRNIEYSKKLNILLGTFFFRTDFLFYVEEIRA